MKVSEAIEATRRTVKARGEAATGSGEDDGADVFIVAELVEDGADIGPHGIVDGIELLGAVELDMGDELGGE